MLVPAYYGSSTYETNLVYPFVPDLHYDQIPYPFDIPLDLPPTDHVAITDDRNDEARGWS